MHAEIHFVDSKNFNKKICFKIDANIDISKHFLIEALHYFVKGC